jgi:hypothetical protein
MTFPLKDSPYIYFNSNPIVDEIINNRQTIINEFFAAAKHRQLTTDYNKLNTESDFLNEAVSKKANASMYDGSFKSITLYMTNKLLDEPEKKEANWGVDETERFNKELVRLMPWSTTFIFKHKNNIGAFNFNISYPGSRLDHHLGLDSNYIRLHFCIQASPHCVFDIEGWKHVWEEGEIFGFDDGNVFHGTNHKDAEGATPRIILMIDMLKSCLEPYAKTWPCRDRKPTRQDVLKYLFSCWDK